MSDFRSVALSNNSSSDDGQSNQNPTDHQRFREFQENLEKTLQKFEVESRHQQRKNNVLQWDAYTSERWRGASLKHHPESIRDFVLEELKKEGPTSFFIKGPSMAGKTHLAYAICRKLIGAGLLTPKGIFVLSEELVLRHANSGFAGRDKLNDLMDRKYSLVVLDGVGNNRFYDSRREEPAMRQMITSFYDRGIPVIFTCRNSAAWFNQLFSESLEGRFVEMFDERIIALNDRKVKTLDDWDDAKESSSSSLPLDKFDG